MVLYGSATAFEQPGGSVRGMFIYSFSSTP